METITKKLRNYKVKAVIISIVMLIILVGKTGFSQTEVVEDSATLREYKIIDPGLSSVLDSFLHAEQICSYYSDSLLLLVDICDWNGNLGDPCSESDTLVVGIASVLKNNMFFYGAVGFCVHKNRFIIIDNFATKKLFIPTTTFRTFRTKEIIRVYRDGAWRPVIRKDGGPWTMWTYLLVNGKFIEKWIPPNCPYSRKE